MVVPSSDRVDFVAGGFVLHVLFAMTLLTLAVVLVTLGTTRVSAICPARCFCDDESLVTKCENSSLDVLPITLNPALRQLYLTRNNIRYISQTLHFYTDLETLDLSRNRLVTLESKCFERQKKLRKLHLGRNIIGNLTSNSFFGLKALRTLVLNGNLLEEIANRTFVHLRTLEELDLVGNRLTAISEEAFVGLNNLRTLRLGENLLSRLPTSSTFAPTARSLRSLSLDGNPLLSISVRSAFGSLPALSELSVEGCRLRDVGATASGETIHVFEGLRNLTVLKLGNNALTYLPSPDEWKHVARLQELVLSNNAFDEIPSGAFFPLKALGVLQADRCPRLRTIKARAFTGCVSLRAVSLNNNPVLAKIESGAFQGMPSVQYLGLSGNALATLPEDAFPYVVAFGVETLDIRGNPLECNCSLSWLREWQRVVNETFVVGGGVIRVNTAVLNVSVSASALVSEVRCDRPDSSRQRVLLSLSDDDLGCNSVRAAAHKRVVLGITSTVVVVCVAAIIFLVYKYRKRVTRVLKDQWTERPMRAKDVHYEKTNDDEENTILQAAAQQSLKMTPVTEL